MKQLKTILLFEISTYFKRKVFIIITILAVLAIAVLLSSPRIIDTLGFGGGATDIEKDKIIALLDETGGISGNAEYYNSFFAQSSLVLEDVYGTAEEIERKVADGDYEAMVILTGLLSYTRIARSISLYDEFRHVFDEAMVSYYRYKSLTDYGMTDETAVEILGAQVESAVRMTELGKDQGKNFFYTYILIFLLYFAVIMYGNLVSSSVATEKSTRAMEILITSAKPKSLMFGKVLGASLAGFSQLLLILASAFVFYSFNSSYYQDNDFVLSIFSMPMHVLIYILVFFVLGFLIYAFIFASFASLVSRMEDLGTITMPVTLIFVVSFMIVMMSMATGSVDSPLIITCSFIPLTSPMAMFVRIALGSVAAWEIAVSIAILIVSVIGIGILAAKIYRLGVLLYGAPPKITHIVKLLITARAERNTANK